ncbi:hypothetical protein EF919_18295 [Streptomyces sp. WAC02707]|uniref:hypothetical protein n=1 Tax=Streptomyces sp. WAC02707 TaxID=2487417 RepID=UPI000F79D97A|nr:hypothetical protein [Streptomyces sp. WAC02707]RSS92485.1 hypothetical protein EF919_18295 [Streptomyces sp. WAC02707]
MTDQTTDRHTCHNQKTATGPAWKCPRCSLPPADQTAPLADRLAHPEAVREQVRRALDFTYAVSLGYESSDQLLATYDASRAPADQTTPLRERIAAALYAHDHPHHVVTLDETGMGPAYRAVADAVLAVLPAPADRAADEVDADTVANRAAQVITAMGAEIRELKHSRDRYRTAWFSARQRAQAFREGILRHVADRDWWKKEAHAVQARAVVENRAAVLRDAADHAEIVALRLRLKHDYGAANGAFEVMAELRRMADETATTEAETTRRRWRVETFDDLANEWNPSSISYLVRDHAVERYRDLTSKSPKWGDGTPVTRRLVRETTTVEVEAEPAAGARQDGAQR